jgi:hypothetical protein
MFRRPGEDYTAHGPHYTATAPHNAHRSYAVSGTPHVLVCAINSAFLPLQSVRHSSLNFDTAHQIHNLFKINKQVYLRLIHSRSPPFDKSTVSPKTRAPHRAIECFFFQFTLSSIFFGVIQQMVTSSSSSSRHFHPSLSHPFNKVFQKTVPRHDVTNPVTLPSVYSV